MRTLLSQTQIFAAIRAYFNVPATMTVDFATVDGETQAIIGGSPAQLAGTSTNESAGSSELASVSLGEATEIAKASESTPKTRSRLRKTTVVAEPETKQEDPADDADDAVIDALDQREAELAETPAPAKKRFGKAVAKSETVEEPDDEVEEDQEQAPEEQEEDESTEAVEETKPAKRVFGKRTVAATAEPEEDEAPVEAPKKRLFGQRNKQ